METKISFYNVVNMFLTGVVFCGCMGIMFFNKIIKYFAAIKDVNIGYELLITVVCFALIYEVGLIINRLSSVLFEEILKKIKLIKHDDYGTYKKAEMKNDFLKILSREYAVSRNFMTVFFLLFIVSLIKLDIVFALSFISLTVLFFFSMKKHSSKISALVKSLT